MSAGDVEFMVLFMLFIAGAVIFTAVLFLVVYVLVWLSEFIFGRRDENGTDRD